MAAARSIPAIVECGKDHCTPIFAGLRDEEFAELQELMVPIAYEAGELIHQEGMLANGIYVICKGLVKYGKYTADRSRKRVLKIFSARDILGLEMLFCQDPCFLSGFAKALEDTKVVFIEKGKLLEFLERHPAVFRRLCEQLSREILIYQCKMAELAYEPMKVNLARLLLILARSYGIRREDGLEIEFSRGDLAELAGTHIDTVVRTLARFKEKGLIATHYHKIKILDEAGLEAVASPLPTCLTEELF